MQNVRQNLSNPIQKQRSQTPNQTTNTKNNHQRQWHTRYRTCPKHKYKHCHVSFKKNKKSLVNLNPKYTNLISPLRIRLEMDEVWGRVYCKKTPCWLWHAINHNMGEVIAYVFGARGYEVL